MESHGLNKHLEVRPPGLDAADIAFGRRQSFLIRSSIRIPRTPPGLLVCGTVPSAPGLWFSALLIGGFGFFGADEGLRRLQAGNDMSDQTLSNVAFDSVQVWEF